MKTVMETRSAPQNHLISSGLERASENLISNGTTSTEAKSGYGLDIETEVKILEATERNKQGRQCATFKPTWLGAHDFPPEYDRDGYVEV